jgi:hypothetical protein
MSLCSRCGKQRITVSTCNEMINNSQVVYTETSCPDPDCQKIVDGVLRNEEKRRNVQKKEQEKRELQRKAQKKSNSIV